MGIIIDLDQTIIDSSIAKRYRDEEQWEIANSLIPKFKLYPNIIKALSNIKLKSIKICIVTTSPRLYTTSVVKHWKIPYDYMVCCDDTINTKPYPEPILKGIELLNENLINILSFGDRDIDIVASKKANILTVACLWGAMDKESLLNTNPDYILNTPHEIDNLIYNVYTLKNE